MKSQIQYSFNIDKNIDKLFINYCNNKNEELNNDYLYKNYKNIKININDKNIEINSKSNNKSKSYIINNYYMYNNSEEPLKYIDEYFNFTKNIYIKYYLIDYVKFQYFQENNYVKYSLFFF